MLTGVYTETYKFFPLFQYSIPKIKADTSECMIRIKLYAGLLQQAKCCFHRQDFNCSQLFCENRVIKYRSLDPGGGLLNFLTSSLFFLKNHIQVFKDENNPNKDC